MDLFALEDVYIIMQGTSSPIIMENTKSKKVITQANFAGYLTLVSEMKYLIYS